MSAAVLATMLVSGGCGSATSSASPTRTKDWQLVFQDDFSGGRLDTSKWNTCHWWNDDGCTIKSSNELEWYLPSQVAVAGGQLDLTADRASGVRSDGKLHDYVSGMVTTGPPKYQQSSKFDFTYGRVTARMKFPKGDGLWSAFWMLPSTSRSLPEIDIVEVLGNDPAEWILHLHPKNEDAEQYSRRVRREDLADGWHDIGLVWEPDRLEWLIDNKVVWTVTGSDVPDEPMYLVANLAVGGVYPGPPTASTEFPTEMNIEEVQVWQRPT